MINRSINQWWCSIFLFFMIRSFPRCNRRSFGAIPAILFLGLLSEFLYFVSAALDLGRQFGDSAFIAFAEVVVTVVVSILLLKCIERRMGYGGEAQKRRGRANDGHIVSGQYILQNHHIYKVY